MEPRLWWIVAALVTSSGCGGGSASGDATPPARSSGAETSERREDPVSASVIAAVRARQADVLSCYDEALDAGRTSGGQLTMRIVVGADGNVVGVAATQDAVGGGVAECVSAVLGTIHAETPPAEPTPFEFPFSFRPASE